MTPDIKSGDIVSVPTNSNEQAGSYIVESIDLENKKAYLYHTCYPKIMLKFPLDILSQTGPLKRVGFTEEALAFCWRNKEYLDYQPKVELSSMLMYFAVKRIFPGFMKKQLSDLGGVIAKQKLNGNLEDAIKLVNENAADLDSFNERWYLKFSKIFSGEEQPTTENQITSIFNMSGFILGRYRSFEEV